MLSVQPKISNNNITSFGRRDRERKLTPDEIEERKYRAARREIEEQQEDFIELSENNEFNLPKPVKTVIKGGAVVTTGLLGGMATGWGAKQSIKAFQKLGKTEVMQGLKKQAVNTNKFIKEAAKTVKTEFLKSDAYKTPKAKLDKFATTKVGKPITKFFKAIGTGISTVYGKIKTGTNYIITKIKGVKKETYEKATVNTVGASGGIASGVTALKEQDEKGRED